MPWAKMVEQPAVYVNGRFVPAEAAGISPLERGFTLADGVFETMVALGHRIFRFDDHFARLTEGASLLELPLPSRLELTEALDLTRKRSGLSEAVLRLTVARGPSPGRGPAPPEGAVPTVVVRAVEFERDSGMADIGLSLRTCSFPRNERSPLTRAKFLAYTEAILALLEARAAGADDALWRNTAGNLVSTTTSNLFLVGHGKLVTPRLEDGALPGVARRTVIELADRKGMEVAEESVPPPALVDADEAFLTNVVRGPIAVVTVDGQPVGSGKPGPLTRELTDAYWREVEAITGHRLA